MKYAIASAVSAITLAFGILVGIILAPHLELRVAAQGKPQQTTTACVSSATVECIAPVFTAGSAGIGTVLAGRVATDNLVVNGYDVLKLQDAVFKLLASKGVTNEQIQAAINTAHPDRQLQLQIAPVPGAK